MVSKRCSYCKTEKPVADFAKKSSSTDGLNSCCRSCDKSRRETNRVFGAVMPTSFAERFMSHVVPVTECGCWLWVARLNSNGYGSVMVDRQHRTAHRVSWAIHNGEIPVGMHVLHKCDVRNCVNPDHLFLGTHQDNMDDKRTKGLQNGINTKQPASKINMSIAVEIRALYPSMSYRQLAAKFGIDPTTVFRTVKGRYWKPECGRAQIAPTI